MKKRDLLTALPAANGTAVIDRRYSMARGAEEKDIYHGFTQMNTDGQGSATGDS